MTTRLQSPTTLRQGAHHLVGLLAMLLLVASIQPVSVGAHASLLGTTPSDGDDLDASPTEIVLDFSEPVGVVEGGTVLYGSETEPMSIDAESRGSQVVISLEQPLGDGAYILQWRVISADSHPVSGTLSFTVGDASASALSVEDSGVPGWIDWARTVAVALQYLGVLSALGILIVGWRLVPADFATASRLAAWFALTGLIGIIAELPFAGMVQRDTVITEVSELWSSVTALDSGTRLAAVTGIVAIVLTVAAIRVSREWLIPTLLLLVAVLTLILSGHTRSREPMWLMMVSDAAHVLTAAIWLGGIILLTLGLRGRWSGEGFATTESSYTAVSRFSSMAGFTAGIVTLSGVAMAVTILDSWEALFNTGYGVTLMVKVSLVVVVMLLAAVNRFWLLPGKERRSKRSITWLQRVVSVELVVLVAIAGVTGSLVHRDPNVQAEPAPVEQGSIVVHEGEHSLDAHNSVRLTVKANASNQVTIVATIIDEDRNIVLPDANLNLGWYLPDRDLGPLNQELVVDASTGAYTGVFSLPQPGEWELGIQVRIDRFTDSRTTIEIVIPD